MRKGTTRRTPDTHPEDTHSAGRSMCTSEHPSWNRGGSERERLSCPILAQHLGDVARSSRSPSAETTSHEGCRSSSRCCEERRSEVTATLKNVVRSLGSARTGGEVRSMPAGSPSLQNPKELHPVGAWRRRRGEEGTGRASDFEDYSGQDIVKHHNKSYVEGRQGGDDEDAKKRSHAISRG